MDDIMYIFVLAFISHVLNSLKDKETTSLNIYRSHRGSNKG